MNVTDKEEEIMRSNQYNKRINKYTMSVAQDRSKGKKERGRKEKTSEVREEETK